MTAETIAAFVKLSREACGLAPKVEDGAVLRKVVQLLADPGAEK